MMLLGPVLLAAISLPSVALADIWGYSEDQDSYVIDTGSRLVFTVSKRNGDITSMRYRGTQTNGYRDMNFHVENGLGPSEVTISQYTDPAIIQVTVTHGSLVQTYIARNGYNNIYMLTNKGDSSVAASQFVVRLVPGLFPKAAYDPNYYDPWTKSVEDPDVSVSSFTGFTKSKHYQGLNYGRTIDYDYIGKAASSLGVWLVRSNREKASGGPFFRSHLRSCSLDSEDLYEILYSNMSATEPERWGLHGPYVLSFTDGGPPDQTLFSRYADWSWMNNLGIKGWVPTWRRGNVVGVGIMKMQAGYTYVAGLSNPNAQYWGTADPYSGSFIIEDILPGTYTLTIYKGELEVYTRGLIVTAGGSIHLEQIMPSDPSAAAVLWRIGEWDGTPAGFHNFNQRPMMPTYMHPSDQRLETWKTEDYFVGQSATSEAMPGYMWKGINDGHRILFKLNKVQSAQGHILRIGITGAYLDARPTIKVNTWSNGKIAGSAQPSTRSLTVGTYRGNNYIFQYYVPADAFSEEDEWNIITINVASERTGSGFLSPGISLDAIDLF